jgi:hypothetical protein
MTTARPLSQNTSQTPLPNRQLEFTTRLSQLEQFIAIDEKFIEDNTNGFLKEYTKHDEMLALLEHSDEIRIHIHNATPQFYDILRAELRGLSLDIQDKISRYKTEYANKTRQAMDNTRHYCQQLLQQKNKLLQYKLSDAGKNTNLTSAFNELLNAYSHDHENLQAQRAAFNTHISTEPAKRTLRELLTGIFFVNHFESRILHFKNTERTELENHIMSAYNAIFSPQIENLKRQLAKQERIHLHFHKSFGEQAAKDLSRLLRILSESLATIEQSQKKSIDDWHINYARLQGLNHDYSVYISTFRHYEVWRRQHSAFYQKINPILERLTVEASKQTDPVRKEFLLQIKQQIKSLHDFYIENEASCASITAEHTPASLDEIAQTHLNNKLTAELTHYSDETFIAWAKTFLSSLLNTKPAAASAAHAQVISVQFSPENESKLKEIELDNLVNSLTNKLCAKTSSYVYPFLSLIGQQDSTADTAALLMKLQQLTADKSDANLQTIMNLTRIKTTGSYAELLWQIHDCTREIIRCRPASATPTIGMA